MAYLYLLIFYLLLKNKLFLFHLDSFLETMFNPEILMNTVLGILELKKGFCEPTELKSLQTYTKEEKLCNINVVEREFKKF